MYGSPPALRGGDGEGGGRSCGAGWPEGGEEEGGLEGDREALGVLSRDVGDTRAGFLIRVRASGFGVDCDICTEIRRPSWSTVMPH
ncbi:hypothetical protein EQG64_11445 [Streptomyces sp. S6]|nr:hypothetical protein EQG64_11445 [Streptomyces sp. S6]